ncbi:unnamed protein product, partial [Rotaria socialis]
QPVRNGESKHHRIILYPIKKESIALEKAPDSQEENVDLSSEDESNSDSEEKDGDDGDENIETPLTPEIEHANMLYHQAMKLINVTINRQYEL